jgi:predicted nucleic acid-binding protein
LRWLKRAEEWGRLNAKRPLPAVDSLLGATANVHQLILATRNISDLRDAGVRVVNPFAFDSG